MSVKYCNAVCQKLRAAELRDEALFKDPPPKEDCPICFLPMPTELICCLSLPPATIASVPIYDFFIAYPGLEFKSTNNFIHAVGKVFVKDAITPFVRLETLGSARFAMPTEVTKQVKRWLTK